MCWQECARRTFRHACVTAGDGTRRQIHTPVRANLHGRMHAVHRVPAQLTVLTSPLLGSLPAASSQLEKVTCLGWALALLETPRWEGWFGWCWLWHSDSVPSCQSGFPLVPCDA